RIAGQIAHQQGIPILFLPGLRCPDWAGPLWGSLSLEEMVEAIAREDIRATRISVGLAGNEMFFGDATCGVLPQLAQLPQALHETEGFSEGWNLFGRTLRLMRTLHRSKIEIHRPYSAPMSASALVVKAQGSKPKPNQARGVAFPGPR